MYAIILKNKGGSYGSVVFGCHVEARSSWEKDWYWIVLNEEKTKLVKRKAYSRKPLRRRVLIADADKSGWVGEEEVDESVGFLPSTELVTLVDEDRVPEELTQLCIEVDRAYHYEEIREVLNLDDARDFDWVSLGLHDARIAECEEEGDELRVLFESDWDCKVEVWFSGDVACETWCRNPEYYDPYWFESAVFFHGGFVYLADYGCASVEEGLDGCCWFRGRSMRYRVIPG